MSDAVVLSHPAGSARSPRRAGSVEPVGRPHLVVADHDGTARQLSRPVARAVVLKALDRLTGGEVALLEPSGRLRRFGRADHDAHGRPPLEATVRVHHPGVYQRVLTAGSVGLGISYADGWWDTDDLPRLLRLLERNVRRADPARRSVRRLTGPVSDRVRRLRRPDPVRDRDDIRAHYDLGNDFFERWLDDTMMYSSAIFPTPEATLTEASTHKLDRLCGRLGLGGDDHVLEISTG
jgi:cyclopropane-fatty-acyl-phospholipid synthase